MTFRVTSGYRIRSNAVGVLVYVRQRFVKVRHRVNENWSLPLKSKNPASAAVRREREHRSARCLPK